MTPAHFEIIGVMGRGNLNSARAKLRVNFFIGNNLNFPVYKGKNNLPANKRLITRIFRMNRHRYVA